MTAKKITTVRRMCDSDLESVLRWRNHPEVRLFMLSQHEMTPAEHRTWFERLSRNEKYALLLVEEAGHPVGSTIFSRIEKNSAAEWSFYSAPGNSPGSGTRICTATLDYAFQVLRVRKVIGKVLDFNFASLRLHRKLGFSEKKILNQYVQIDGSAHSLIYFEVLHADWLTAKNFKR